MMDEKYEFLQVLDEDKKIYKDHLEPIITPPQSPINSNLPLSSSSSSESSNSGSSLSPPRKIRSFDDLYEVHNPIDDDVTLYCQLATCDPIVFEEVVKDKKWRIIMDKEIALIKKNDTWKLVPRPRGKKPIDVK
jgi:hypothetical protein